MRLGCQKDKISKSLLEFSDCVQVGIGGWWVEKRTDGGGVV